MRRVPTAGVLSQGQGPLTAQRDRGRALAYRSAPPLCAQLRRDAAGRRLPRTPLTRATPAVGALRVLSL